MAISIETRSIGDTVVATIVGDSLETENVAGFRGAITPILDRAKRVVLDLSQVSFMDSTGLGSMLSCLRSVKAKGGEMKLCSLTPEVRQLFEMVLMDRVFEIYPDEPSALAALGK